MNSSKKFKDNIHILFVTAAVLTMASVIINYKDDIFSFINMSENILNAGYSFYLYFSGWEYMDVIPRSTFIIILLLSTGNATLSAFGFLYSYIFQELIMIQYMYLIEFVLFVIGIIWTSKELWSYTDKVIPE